MYLQDLQNQRYLHLSKKSISFVLSSDNTSPLNSAVIRRSSFYCKSTQRSVFFPVCWCTFDCIHKTICFIFSNKWLDCFSKTLWQHSCSYYTSANLSECNINLNIQFQLVCHWQCIKNIIRIWCRHVCVIQETLIKVFHWTEIQLSGRFITKLSFWELWKS